MKKSVIAISIAVAFTAPAVTGQDRDSELLRQIELLQAQIDELKAEVTANKEAVVVAVENAALAGETADIAIEAIEEESGRNTSLSGISIGGYGELHYNNLDSGSEIDFHRFVMFFGNEFNERLRFFSEIELEHSIAGEGKAGEYELEQAYIEYDLSANNTVKGGLFLVPVGILNETHEPPTFYGVERNGIEKEIIPATWWEAGAAYSGRLDTGLSYDFALHSGLKVPVTGSNAFRIRSGRQKVGEASAEDFAFTGRVRYTGIPGLELGMSVQRQSDITQGIEDAPATLFETHAAWYSGSFSMRALYASWDIDSEIAESLGKDRQKGFYVEPGYRVNETLGLFARYGEYNTQAGLTSSEAIKQLDFGANIYLHEDVVVKLDYQNQSGSGNDDGINIGLGYQF